MRVLGVVLFVGCGFAPHAAIPPAPGDGGPMDAPDARVIDGNDAMAANGRRKPITFVGSKISGTQTDFPVWIDVIDTQIGQRAQADGKDIFFTAGDGITRLDHQLRWDPGTHHLTAWVRVPSLVPNPATVIYVNYGDPGAAPLANPPGVFKASFAGVWHLDDAISATAIADATNTHNGVPTFTTTTTATGQLGGALQFKDSSDQINFQNPLSGSNPHTISVWVKQPSVNHVSSMVTLGTGTQFHARWFYAHYTAATFACGFFADDWVANNSIDNNQWTLLHWVYEGGNTGINRLYKNGAEVSGSPQTLNNVNTMGTSGMIGFAPAAYGNNMGLEGYIDEVRIATMPRSPGWITTEYANQSQPSTFYGLGDEEMIPQ